jgi:hypothetical protein
MKNEIFFMSVNFLNIWRLGTPKSWHGILLANKNSEIVDVSAYCRKKYKNHSVLASVYFSNYFKFSESTIYTSFLPEESFIECAKHKKISCIYYYSNKNINEENSNYCIRYNQDFCKVADLFANSLNTV